MTAIERRAIALAPLGEGQDDGEPTIDTVTAELTVTRAPWKMAAKRAVDVGVSALVLFLMTPFLLMVAVAIRVTTSGPVLYRQTRLGIDGKPFTLLKFRTMVNGAHDMLDQVTHLNSATGPFFKAHRDPRLTPLGRILRRCFFDELPQLVNVLRGDMSLVGPRPCLPAESSHMPQFRFKVPQGVTGPWQVNGHHALTPEELAKVELRYVSDWSLTGDFAILVRTVALVVRLRGL